jgi:positive regulator of sigma E activity
MNSLRQTIAVVLTTFGASVVAMFLQGVVPAQMLAESRGTVGAMVGLVTLLLALVLGFLVFTAFSVFSTQQSEAQSLGPLVIELDVAFERYGSDAAIGRSGLRAALERSRRRFFGDIHRGPQPWTFEETRATLLWLSGYFDSLKPLTDRQHESLATARDLVKRFNDTQMLMARQLANPFPPYVILVVVCWASALFFGNGLVAVVNAVTVIAHLAGAAAIGSAIFLILELSQPYTGFVRLSSAGVDRLLLALAEIEAKRAGS